MKREATGRISEALRSVEVWVAVAMFLVVIPLTARDITEERLARRKP
jgi:hypothetical protein